MNAEASPAAAEFVRDKIREIVTDPETAEALLPTTDHAGRAAPASAMSSR